VRGHGGQEARLNGSEKEHRYADHHESSQERPGLRPLGGCGEQLNDDRPRIDQQLGRNRADQQQAERRHERAAPADGHAGGRAVPGPPDE
jgi:hypothetical protein